jgi:hypothetical protein
VTYERAKEIVEWVPTAPVGIAMKYQLHEIITALAVMALVQDNKANS